MVPTADQQSRNDQAAMVAPPGHPAAELNGLIRRITNADRRIRECASGKEGKE